MLDPDCGDSAKRRQTSTAVVTLGIVDLPSASPAGLPPAGGRRPSLGGSDGLMTLPALLCSLRRRRRPPEARCERHLETFRTGTHWVFPCPSHSHDGCGARYDCHRSAPHDAAGAPRPYRLERPASRHGAAAHTHALVGALRRPGSPRWTHLAAARHPLKVMEYLNPPSPGVALTKPSEIARVLEPLGRRERDDRADRTSPTGIAGPKFRTGDPWRSAESAILSIMSSAEKLREQEMATVPREPNLASVP